MTKIEATGPPLDVVHGLYYSKRSARLYVVHHNERAGESVEVYDVVEPAASALERLRHLGGFGASLASAERRGRGSTSSTTRSRRAVARAATSASSSRRGSALFLVATDARTGPSAASIRLAPTRCSSRRGGGFGTETGATSAVHANMETAVAYGAEPGVPNGDLAVADGPPQSSRRSGESAAPSAMHDGSAKPEAPCWCARRQRSRR